MTKIRFIQSPYPTDTFTDKKGVQRVLYRMLTLTPDL